MTTSPDDARDLAIESDEEDLYVDAINAQDNLQGMITLTSVRILLHSYIKRSLT